MTPEYRDTALLFSRAGFGGLHGEITKYESMPWADKVDMVLDLSRAPAETGLPDLSPGRDWYDKWVDMTHFWLERARRPVDRAPIQEKIALFWHGHLCSGLHKTGDHRAMFEQNRLFRRRGMGNVETLLWETSIGPAMIQYLDNDRNVAGSINENFARELMELFTLGVGHYNEVDVRESARAWTGHGLDDNDRYRFNAALHDSGTKTFLGQTGRWDGRDIVRLIVNRRREAHSRFLCRKLWSFFAYPVGLNDPEVTDIMATYRTNLDISQTLRAIFLHPRFRSDRTRQGLVRSPFEYVVALMRHTGLTCDQAHPEWYLSTMGQTPYDPPNVSGWGQNDYWISETATWSKGQMVSYLRWQAYERGDLENVNDIVSYNPTVFRYGPDAVVDAALNNFRLRLISPTTRRAIVEYVKAERASDSSWGQRAGLLFLPLLTPEFQLA